MNLACSYLQPIEGVLADVIDILVESNKIRMNMKRGKEMMNEIKFWAIDPDEDSTDDDGGIGEVGDEDAELQRILSEGGIDNEDDDAKDVHAEENRTAEREQIYYVDGSIKDFEVEPEVEQCATDFWTKPYAKASDIDFRAVDEVRTDPLIPINFYDNDDGFWNGFI